MLESVKGAPDITAKLKASIQTPPFESENKELKMEVFYTVMQCIKNVKAEHYAAVCDSFTFEEQLTLMKFLFKGWEMVHEKDPKTLEIVNPKAMLDLLAQIKEKHGPSAILKVGFERKVI